MNLPHLIHGDIPEVAALQPTDPIAELKKLLSGEITAWPQIQELGGLFQDYMLGGLNEAIPGFSDILAQGGIDTQAMLEEAEPLIRGELPQDVKDQVLRSSAFTNLMSGGGGQFLQSLQARDLGLTSLDLMGKGAAMAEMGGNAAQRWAGIAQGTMLNPSANMYSPAWFTDFMAKQRASQQAVQQQRFNMAAMPDPAAAAIAGTLLNFAGMYAGRGMGGGNSQMMPTYSSVMGGGGGMSVGAGQTFGSPFNAAPAPDYKGIIPYQGGL